MIKNSISLFEVQIIPIKPNNGLVAFASCVLNNQFYIGNIGIHLTPSGDFRLVYPSKILPNGKQINCFHPITREAGEALRWAIINKYNQIIIDNEIKKDVARNWNERNKLY